MTTLAELYQQSQAQLPVSSSSNRLPNVALGLGQIVQSSGRLVKGSKGVRRDDGQAQYLFSQQGLSHRSIPQSLAALSSLAGPAPAAQWQPPHALSDTDVTSYLSLRKETIIIAAMEECRQQCQADVQETLRKRLDDDWEKERAKLMEELGGYSGAEVGGGGGMDVDEYSSQPSSSKRTLSAPESTIKLHTRMMKYDEIIRTLNDFRKQKRPFALMSYISHVITTGTDLKSPRLPAIFSLLTSLLREHPTSPSTGDFGGSVPISEREYAKGYLGGEGDLDKVELGGMLAEGGRRWLEESFMVQLEKLLSDRVADAKLGGRPGAANKIRAFVNLLERDGKWNKSLEKVSQNSLWAEVYLLLRTGHEEEARELLQSPENALNRKDKNLVGWLLSWMDSPSKRLSKEERDALVAEWKITVRGSMEKNGDPFKFALYKLIGRVDLTKRNIRGVTETTDDWLWLQLSLVKEGVHPGEGASERYALKDLGRIVEKLGPKHYDPTGTMPLEYFSQLVLTGQFERAVAFLHGKSSFNVDAVHIGIALAYYGLIRVPSKANTSDTELLTSSPGPNETTVDYLNFSRMIQRYTRMFVKTDTPNALQYVYLIALNGDAPGSVGMEQKEICWKMIGDVVMETKSYSLLLGEEGVENSSVIGKDISLINVPDSKTFISNLVREAANRPTSDLPLHDLVKLYSIAGEWPQVMYVLNKALSESLSVTLTPEDFKTEDPLRQYGLETVQRLNHQGAGLPLEGKHVFNVLINLKDALRAKAQNQYAQCLELIQATGLIPLEHEVPGITRAAEQFKFLDELIMRNIDRVLIMAMSSLFELHAAEKKQTFGGSARLNNMQMLRKKSRALMMFAGMLRYRMSSDTYAQLAKLDAFF